MFPRSFVFFVVSLIVLSQYTETCFSIPDGVTLFSFPVIGNAISSFLRFENASYVNSEGIQVTPPDKNAASTNRVGRATYYQPFHLWDYASGEEASFKTHFSFVINSLGQKTYGDGLAFFLAPNGSTIPPDSYDGTLGLTPHNNPTDSTLPFVAVEFDTFFNDNFDTINSTHVGIDVKSMKSVRDVVWWSGVQTGNVTDAWISYESHLKLLSVTFTNFFPDGTVGNGSVSYPLNLTELLPEWVTFGFSASTGGLFEQNTIKSWDFSSAAAGAGAATNPPHHGMQTWAIVTISISGAFVVITMGGCYIYRRFYTKRSIRMEDQHFSPKFINY